VTSGDVGPPRGEEELEQFCLILTESLNFPAREEVDYLTRYRAENMRLVRRGGRVAGGLTLLPCGQFFAGQRVSMTGIHAVAIAPEARGAGAGRDLIAAAIDELAGDGGPALAALYPATQPVYRRVGFEQAGTFTRYRVPVASLPVGPHDLELERVPADASVAADLLGDVYGRVARGENGFVDRTLWFWQRAIEPLHEEVAAFCVREAGAITGYAVLARRWETRARPHSDIVCREWLAETPAAASRLWTLFADERSLARSLLVTGPPAPPEQLVFAEQAADVDWQIRWMLRVLDVEAALAARGYADGVERRVALEVEDDRVARNRDRFSLEVAGGRASVVRGAGGAREAVRIGIRGLAALYSGYLSAEQLARAGMASGARDALAALTAVFAGPAPWLGDIF
jgi:predicted acetyltransferase